MKEAWPLHDMKRGIELLERACDGAYAGACSSLGAVYEEQNRAAEAKKARDRAKALFARECQHGQGNSCWAAIE